MHSHRGAGGSWPASVTVGPRISATPVQGTNARWTAPVPMSRSPQRLSRCRSYGARVELSAIDPLLEAVSVHRVCVAAGRSFIRAHASSTSTCLGCGEKQSVRPLPTARQWWRSNLLGSVDHPLTLLQRRGTMRPSGLCCQIWLFQQADSTCVSCISIFLCLELSHLCHLRLLFVLEALLLTRSGSRRGPATGRSAPLRPP